MTDGFGSSVWSFVVVAGPIILGLALLFAILRSKRTRVSERESDRGAAQLRKELSAEDRARGG